MINIPELIMAAIKYDHGDARRIQHFIKVHDFALTIGRLEHMPEEELNTLEAAAVLHDIGIHNCEIKYGNTLGKNQETEGPVVARDILADIKGCTDAQTERICYLIAHHHTYDNIDGIDYRILIEADMIVNAYEDNLSKAAIEKMYDKIFRTESGKRIFGEMFEIK